MTDPLSSPTTPHAVQRAAHAPVKTALTQRQAAEKLEASFLAEMLKSAGVGTSPSFGGGIGEDQFASYQRQALAEEMVKSGGIGLAETFYQALVEKQNDQ
ncbi:rod-binding protein [Rhodobacteraceae bacterium KMM 6894]|nr:rod-binding protein [Rhodobacteraceae bacterium KMM 6894]